MNMKTKCETETPRVPRIKVLTIGNCMVGKSCIVKRLCEQKYYERYKPTIGIDYGTRKFLHSNQKEIKLDFWDMSGHSEFEEVRSEFYEHTQVCLIVFDCTEKQSFDELPKWLQEAQKYNMPQDALIYIVCNKIDSRYRVISSDRAKQWCDQQSSTNNSQFRYFETSAQSGKGIQPLFDSVFKAFSC